MMSETEHGEKSSDDRSLHVNNIRPATFDQWANYEKLRFAEAFNEIFANSWIGYRGWRQELVLDDDLVEKVAEKIPYRTPADVKELIRVFSNKVVYYRNEAHYPIDKWLELIESLSPDDNDDVARQLGNTMKAARKEPVQTGPVETEPVMDESMPQPDYYAIYNYLQCAMTGEDLPQLSPIDSLVVEDCMQALMYQIQCLEDERLGHSLRKVYLHLTKKLDQFQEHDYETMKKNLLHNASVYNPLGLNFKAVMPTVPDR